ncbi:hypothetical protein Cabys_2593 [Caldithrix abyssi DSM 13497]|uniref:Uncharacterized protein n=1 Tax=Caldithrix abyssi DSM 13497 TaxID=880073 RepID=A0A1J1C9W9_CALAY|nr:hypothetical protein Cabys_2593 [Caldithrix abyssi DSM 13497]
MAEGKILFPCSSAVFGHVHAFPHVRHEMPLIDKIKVKGWHLPVRKGASGA